MMWRVENSRIMGVQMDNFRGLLGIKGMNSTPNVQIKKLCGIIKGVNEKIDENVF